MFGTLDWGGQWGGGTQGTGRKRFGLRINLIAAIYNWQIDNLND